MLKFMIPCTAKFDLEDGQLTILLPQSWADHAEPFASDEELAELKKMGIPVSFAIGFEEIPNEPS